MSCKDETDFAQFSSNLTVRCLCIVCWNLWKGCLLTCTKGMGDQVFWDNFLRRQEKVHIEESHPLSSSPATASSRMDGHYTGMHSCNRWCMIYSTDLQSAIMLHWQSCPLWHRRKTLPGSLSYMAPSETKRLGHCLLLQLVSAVPLTNLSRRDQGPWM